MKNHYYELPPDGVSLCKYCGDLITHDDHDPEYWFHDSHGSHWCQSLETMAEPYSEESVTITLPREAVREFALYWADHHRSFAARRRIAKECLHVLKDDE